MNKRSAITRFLELLNISMESVFANKVRSLLTTLGIIFGVASVIAMLSIGTGAQQEILEQMKTIGVNNIIIQAIKESDKKTASTEMNDDNDPSQKDAQKISKGLSIKEAEAIKATIPNVVRVSPESSYAITALKNGIQKKAELKGVTPEYFHALPIKILQGNVFSQIQYEQAKPVCLISDKLSARLFAGENPLGKTVKCDDVWFTIIGTYESMEEDSNSDLGVSNSSYQLIAPLTAVLQRINDRSIITQRSIRRSRRASTEVGDLNQVDKIVVQVAESDVLQTTAEIIGRQLARKHNGVQDYKIIVPLILLQQEQRTKDIFNIVLGAIAGISLIVGGIGIMNIMLASVMERIREIGVRRSVGARKKDITAQFLIESTLISIFGGIIGIILGVVLSFGIERITNILTIISPLSIFISFTVAAAVGIIFGYAPAKKASEQDIVESLRHD
ncbi:ABC transporter permease [Bacteroidales bacterium OttesenSCG-928-J16]|nr:ABC transporter permease [Bacteroidales bacterium OttesenSCG-928-J16]